MSERVRVRGSAVGKTHLVNRARELRQTETQAEQIIWSWLRDYKLNGVKFRRQQPICKYIVDFASFEKKLIIEIDGGQHSFEENKDNDDVRTAWLESQGFRVLRFWNNEVSSNLDGVFVQIGEPLEVHPHPSPLPSKGVHFDCGRKYFVEDSKGTKFTCD
jgi:very-short-patch-repair endonuclease